MSHSELVITCLSGAEQKAISKAPYQNRNNNIFREGHKCDPEHDDEASWLEKDWGARNVGIPEDTPGLSQGWSDGPTSLFLRNSVWIKGSSRESTGPISDISVTLHDRRAWWRALSSRRNWREKRQKGGHPPGGWINSGAWWEGHSLKPPTWRQTKTPGESSFLTLRLDQGPRTWRRRSYTVMLSDQIIFMNWKGNKFWHGNVSADDTRRLYVQGRLVMSTA